MSVLRKLSLMRIIFCAALFVVLAAAANAQTRPAAPTTQTAEVRTHPPDISFLQLLAKGGWFMAPIGAASLIGFALILERSVALRRNKIIPRWFMRDLKGIVSGRSVYS